MDGTNEQIFVIPEELSNMTVLTMIVSPVMEDVGILLLGENLDGVTGELVIIRVYLALKEGGEYHLERELEAVAFEKATDATRFAMELPNMTALELMLLMNGIHSPGENTKLLQ